jgi:hypothetical protein
MHRMSTNAHPNRTGGGRGRRSILTVTSLVISLVISLLLSVAMVLGGPPATVGAASAPSRFVPVRPCRLFDTREAPGSTLRATTVARVQVSNRCGVDSNAVAAALTVTAIQPADSGYATIFPAGSTRPVASAINYLPGQTIANLQLVQLGAAGDVSLYTLRTSHFVVDVTGYFEPAPGGSSSSGRYVPTGTRRVLDTRESGRPALRSAVTVDPGVPVGAVAVAVTITTTATRGAGFFTAYAAGDRLPLASVLNVDGRGQTRSASAIVPLSPTGFEVYTHGGDHVIVDVTGYFTGPGDVRSSTGLFVASRPTRLADTRLGAGPSGGPRLWDGGTREFASVAVTGVPVAAVAANITVTNTEDAGYVLAYPARTPRPLASTVNFDAAGTTEATSSVIQTSTAGIAVYALEATHLVIDITGWFTGAPSAATGRAPSNTPPGDRRVVVIGDSAMAGLRWNGALGGLRGFVAVTDLESCRRLVERSCRGREGYVPLTAAEQIMTLPFASKEDILVVATGYNDWHEGFSADFDTIVALARGKGFHHIAWVDYRSHVGYMLPSSGGTRSNYGEMNRIIDEKIASRAFPEVRRWRLDQYTAPSIGWFYADGVHHTPLGSWAVADWLSRQVRAFDDRPCAEPWVPGGPVANPCPLPELSAATNGLPDIAALYGL